MMTMMNVRCRMSHIDDDDECYMSLRILGGKVMKIMGVGGRMSHVNDDDGCQVSTSRLDNAMTRNGDASREKNTCYARMYHVCYTHEMYM